MSNIRTSVSQLIGHTPLLELANIEKKDNLSVRILFFSAIVISFYSVWLGGCTHRE